MKKILKHLRIKGTDSKINEIIEVSEKKIDEIQPAGLCTDICVISNALAIKTFLRRLKYRQTRPAARGSRLKAIQTH